MVPEALLLGSYAGPACPIPEPAWRPTFVARAFEPFLHDQDFGKGSGLG